MKESKQPKPTGDVPHRGDEIPCQEYDPELWFAERPEQVEFAKTLCGRARCGSSASPARSSGGSPGGSGVDS